MKSSEIRQAFLDFFKQHQHEVVATSPLIPANDPTLLFTNAGMVQFKDVFLGQDKRAYTRAVTAQRCLRAGGKHNDLENVGYTARHHTFFEMLGNFSFGDYFKREAITYAWTFLTEVLKLPKEKLWVTVYQDDDEAADIWLNEIGVSKDRFSRCGEKDNFWSMGDTGPCGPCSEIFYDHGPSIPGGPPGSPEADLDRYIEIWNLVFMQFNRDKDGVLHPLPKPSVDTGMGLERIAAVVQGVHNNYDIDTFVHLIRAVLALGERVDGSSPSVRVVADHIRACAFLIADGVIPSNEGRGYVLRRIIRRAVRHGNKLHLKAPFFHQLVGPLIEVMGQAYPVLIEKRELIEQVLMLEENQFGKTIEMGLKILNDAIGALSSSVIPGEVVFKLYDTYGFPYDLTADIAREHGLQVDKDGFEACMDAQRQQSQAASKFEIDYNATTVIDVASCFEGYDRDESEACIEVILKEGQPVASLKASERGALVLNHTPFYPQGGGQVGDIGMIQTGHATFIVEDTQKQGEAIVHIGRMEAGELTQGAVVRALIDAKRREAIRLNHSATHLLHAALRAIVGRHVEQKGSLVDAERARFDFSHLEGLRADELAAVEEWVNEKIRRNVRVETKLMTPEQAEAEGAMALFGEKYGEEVRVLSMGDFSKELCGGTHARRTGDIALFKIVAEYGVASGVRRIEMVTGEHALRWINQQLSALASLVSTLKTTPDLAMERLNSLLEDNKRLEKAQALHEMQQARASNASLLQAVKSIHGVDVLIAALQDADLQRLRTSLDDLKSRLDNGVIVLYSQKEDTLSVVAGVSKSLLGRVPGAPVYVRALCGKGGGREDMAQGGGKVSGDVADKIKEIEALIEQALTGKDSLSC